MARRRAAAFRFARHHGAVCRCFDELVGERRPIARRPSSSGCRSRIASARRERQPRRISRRSFARFLTLLDEAEDSVAELDWPNSKSALLHGFHRGQKRLRRDWKTRVRTRRPDALHSWRKRVKDQAAQLAAFPPGVPPRFASGSPRRRRRRSCWATSMTSGSCRSGGVTVARREAAESSRQASRRRSSSSGAPCAQRRSAKAKASRPRRPKDLVRKIGEAWDKAIAREAKRGSALPPGRERLECAYFSSAVKTPSHCWRRIFAQPRDPLPVDAVDVVKRSGAAPVPSRPPLRPARIDPAR